MSTESVTTEERAHEIVRTLDTVIDPELGIGIVSLGLVYRVAVEDNGDVAVLMTLTVPGCPMHETITRDVDTTLRRVPWVNDVTVNLTFDPPWSLDRLSDDARQQLGH